MSPLQRPLRLRLQTRARQRRRCTLPGWLAVAHAHPPLEAWSTRTCPCLSPGWAAAVVSLGTARIHATRRISLALRQRATGSTPPPLSLPSILRALRGIWTTWTYSLAVERWALSLPRAAFRLTPLTLPQIPSATSSVHMAFALHTGRLPVCVLVGWQWLAPRARSGRS